MENLHEAKQSIKSAQKTTSTSLPPTPSLGAMCKKLFMYYGISGLHCINCQKVITRVIVVVVVLIAGTFSLERAPEEVLMALRAMTACQRQ